LIAILCLSFGSAGAVEVFVNEVKVTGSLKGTDFAKVDVSFDARGDIHIHAPDYQIQQAGKQGKPAPVAPAASASLSAKYWFIMNVPATGHYRVSVEINGKPMVDIPSSSPQYVREISDKLRPGENAIKLTLLPEPKAPKLPNPLEALNIMLGEGKHAADGSLAINKVLSSFKYNTGRASAEAHTLRIELKP